MLASSKLVKMSRIRVVQPIPTASSEAMRLRSPSQPALIHRRKISVPVSYTNVTLLRQRYYSLSRCTACQSSMASESITGYDVVEAVQSSLESNKRLHRHLKRLPRNCSQQSLSKLVHHSTLASLCATFAQCLHPQWTGQAVTGFTNDLQLAVSICIYSLPQ